MTSKLTKITYQLVLTGDTTAPTMNLPVTMPTADLCHNVARDLARQRLSERHNDLAGPDDITTTRDSFDISNWLDDTCTVSHDGVVVAVLYRPKTT